MRLLSLTIGFVMVLGSLCVQAETYYVSRAGNDEHTGVSKTSAWASIDKVNATQFAPGDTILFEGEEIFPGSIYFAPEVKGTPEQPIVLGSFGTGRAVISSGTSFGLYAYNTAGFKIENLVFQGSGRDTNVKAGVDFYMDLPNARLAYITLDNVEAYGYREAGIRIGSWKGSSGFDDVSITNCSAHDNGDAGISTYAEGNLIGHRNVLVYNSKAYNNAGILGKNKNTGNGIVLGGVNGGVIEYCEAYNNGWQNQSNNEGPVGIWCYASNNVRIQYNESHHNKTGSTKDGGGFDIDGGSTNCVMQYNYSHDNDGAGYLLAQYGGAPIMKGLTVRYNISENDGRKNGYGAIHLWSSGSNDGIQDAQIYNNTIYLTPAASGVPKAVWVQTGGATAATFRNNLFVTTGSARLVQVDANVTANVRFEGNNYWSSGATPSFNWGGTVYSSLANWRTNSTQESRNGVALGYALDPKLKGPGKSITISDAKQLYTLEGYKLLSASPLVGKGLKLATEFSINTGKRDFWGNSITQRNDLCIGAHQLTNSSSACLYGGPQPLTFGLAAAGTYTGPGVAADLFTPEIAGVGNHALAYTYTDDLGATQTEHHTIRVIDTNATQWTGASGSTDWFDGQNWSTCVPTPHINVRIPASAPSFPSIKTGQHGLVHDLDAVGLLTLEQSASLELYGALKTANLSIHPNSSIIFNSDTLQTIPAGTYGSLLLQGSGTRKLAGPVTISRQLDLTQGKLQLGGNSLLIEESGSILNFNAGSYILTDGAGKLTYAGMAAGLTKVFPVGTSMGYAPVSLRNDGVTDDFSVRVEEKALSAADTAGDESKIRKTWYIEEATAGGSDVTMVLQWAIEDEPETFDRTQSYVSHYEDDEWQVMESSTGMVTQGTNADTYRISLSGVSSFSPFTVASSQSAPTPLPVSLAMFTAVKQGNEVLLEWATASEQNNHGFYVEVSEDGKHFNALSFVKSKSPNTVIRQQYTYRDREPGKYGTRYYRLRQVDQDGTTTYSFVRAVDFKQARLSLSVYPNPFTDMVTLELETEQEEDLALTLTDTKGKKLLQRSVTLPKGSSRLPLNLSGFKDASFYILTARIGNKTYHFKLLKQ